MTANQLLSYYRWELEEWRKRYVTSREGSNYQAFCEGTIATLERVVAQLKVLCLEEAGILTGRPQ